MSFVGHSLKISGKFFSELAVKFVKFHTIRLRLDFGWMNQLTVGILNKQFY